MAEQLDQPLSSIRGYGDRPQTVTDHAREAMAALGMRPSNQGDLELMIEAAAQAAWAGDRGTTIVQAVVDALKGAGIVLPTIGRIERAAIAGRTPGAKKRLRRSDPGISPAHLDSSTPSWRSTGRPAERHWRGGATRPRRRRSTTYADYLNV